MKDWTKFFIGCAIILFIAAVVYTVFFSSKSPDKNVATDNTLPNKASQNLSTNSSNSSPQKPASSNTVLNAPSQESSDYSSKISARMPVVSVSAAKLYFDYHANEVQADNVYKGKRLEVEGLVTEIRKDFTESIVVELASQNRLESVDARLVSSEARAAAALQKYQTVDVICTGDGMIMGSPQLEDCIIQPTQKTETSERPSKCIYRSG